MKKKKSKPTDRNILEMENRLRPCIMSHYETLFAKTVDEDEARKKFLEQTVDRVSTLYEERWEDRPKEIKLASIDFEKASIHRILNHHCEERAADFFKIAMPEEKPHDGSNYQRQQGDCYPGINFVSLPHITMEHHNFSTEEDMKASFGHLQGCEVEISIMGLLWSESIAALAIDIPGVSIDGKSIPRCKNDFAHITVWFADGAEAFMSNQLPSQVESGQARRIDFSEPIPLTGAISFWNFENKPTKV